MLGPTRRYRSVADIGKLLARVLRSAASALERRTRDRTASDEPFERTLAVLRERYSDAPEHWLRFVAERMSLAGSTMDTAEADDNSGRATPPMRIGKRPRRRGHDRASGPQAAAEPAAVAGGQPSGARRGESGASSPEHRTSAARRSVNDAARASVAPRSPAPTTPRAAFRVPRFRGRAASPRQTGEGIGAIFPRPDTAPRVVRRFSFRVSSTTDTPSSREPEPTVVPSWPRAPGRPAPPIEGPPARRGVHGAHMEINDGSHWHVRPNVTHLVTPGASHERRNVSALGIGGRMERIARGDGQGSGGAFAPGEPKWPELPGEPLLRHPPDGERPLRAHLMDLQEEPDRWNGLPF